MIFKIRKILGRLWELPPLFYFDVSINKFVAPESIVLGRIYGS